MCQTQLKGLYPDIDVILPTPLNTDSSYWHRKVDADSNTRTPHIGVIISAKFGGVSGTISATTYQHFRVLGRSKSAENIGVFKI